MMGIEQVLDFYGNELDDNAEITVKKQLKLAMLDHKKTLVADLQEGIYIACTKQDLYQGDKKIHTWTTACDHFQPDNDIEECYEEDENACYNCLYRKWTADGFSCLK